jgi:hypothetical protein
MSLRSYGTAAVDDEKAFDAVQNSGVDVSYSDLRMSVGSLFESVVRSILIPLLCLLCPGNIQFYESFK